MASLTCGVFTPIYPLSISVEYLPGEYVVGGHGAVFLLVVGKPQGHRVGARVEGHPVGQGRDTHLEVQVCM